MKHGVGRSCANLLRDGVQNIYEIFRTLPPRSLKDYYEMIEHPVSFNSIRKRIRGIHSRAESTGVTDFTTWSSFEDEVSLLWKNAWTYNEDGSDLYNLATEMKVNLCLRHPCVQADSSERNTLKSDWQWPRSKFKNHPSRK
jgi:hypothetical protein